MTTGGGKNDPTSGSAYGRKCEPARATQADRCSRHGLAVGFCNRLCRPVNIDS